jgi:hypothetical protein
MSQYYYTPVFTPIDSSYFNPDHSDAGSGLMHPNASHDGRATVYYAPSDNLPGYSNYTPHPLPNEGVSTSTSASDSSEPGLLYAEDFAELEMQLSMLYHGYYPRAQYTQEAAMSSASSSRAASMVQVTNPRTLNVDPTHYQPNDFGLRINQNQFTSSPSALQTAAPEIISAPVPSYGWLQPDPAPVQEFRTRPSQDSRRESSLTPAASPKSDLTSERLNRLWPGYEHTTTHPGNYALVCPMPIINSGRACEEMVPMNEFMSHLSSKHVWGSLQAVNEDASIWTCPLRREKGGLCDRTVAVGGRKSSRHFSARHELRMIMEHVLASAHSFLIKGVPISWGPRGEWFPEIAVRRAGLLPHVVCRHCGRRFRTAFGTKLRAFKEHVEVEHPDRISMMGITEES